MRTHKIVWKTIGIPEALFEKIRKIIEKTGDPSIAEYVRVATLMRMRSDEVDLWEGDFADRMEGKE